MECNKFTKNGFCPQGLDCSLTHNHAEANITGNQLSKALDVIFTLFQQEKRARSRMESQLKSIQTSLTSIQMQIANQQFNYTTNRCTKRKLDSLTDRMERLETSIKTHGLPLRAGDLTFNPSPLKISHNPESMLSRGGIVTGKQFLLDKTKKKILKGTPINKYKSKGKSKPVKKSASNSHSSTPYEETINDESSVTNEMIHESSCQELEENQSIELGNDSSIPTTYLKHDSSQGSPSSKSWTIRSVARGIFSYGDQKRSASQ